MIIGVPREIKEDECRVALLPEGVKELTMAGHQVIIQKGAGKLSGFLDNDYIAAGAVLVSRSEEVWRKSALVVKVKEPVSEEYDLISDGQVVFTFLHLAAAPVLADVLAEKKAVALAYETIQLPDGSLPLLEPMSNIAGRMAVQAGAGFLTKTHGGSGILLGGVAGVPPATVNIIGGGAAGTSAAKMALGMGAQVTLLDINTQRLHYLQTIFGSCLVTLMSNSYNIEKAVISADLLISAVLLPGAKAPCLVTASMVRQMKKGSVIVDVSVDQGGAVETIDCVTTHSNPVFEKHGIIHYAVANMPGAVPRTASFALSNATFPYVKKIAALGYREAILNDPALAKGANVVNGYFAHEAVANALGKNYTPVHTALS